MKLQFGIVATVVALLVIIVLASLILVQKQAMDNLEMQLVTERQNSQILTDTVARLTQQRAIDDRVVTEFTKGLAELKTSADFQNRALTELEKNDPAVKDYFAIPIPDALGRLLNNGHVVSPGDAGTP